MTLWIIDMVVFQPGDEKSHVSAVCQPSQIGKTVQDAVDTHPGIRGIVVTATPQRRVGLGNAPIQ